MYENIQIHILDWSQQRKRITAFMRDVLVHDPEVLRIIIDTPEYKALMKHPQHEYIWEPLNLEQIQHHVRIDLADGGYFNKVIIILPECILAGSDFKSVV